MAINWANVTVKLADLQPWEHNPRTMTKRQAQRLLKSWDTLGQFQTIAIGPHGEVYDGHQRLNALLAAHGPLFEIEARQCERELNDDERAALTLAANIPAGAWDWNKLAQWDAGAMSDWGMDKETLATWNNDAANLATMLQATEEETTDADAEPQIDRAAELNEKWQVKRGDLWRIGEHRLLCGDSTKREDVERVMENDKADLLFTSPPYAAQRDYEIGDFDWLGVMLGMSDQAIDNMKDNASILVNLGLVHVGGRVDRYWDEWIDWMEDSGQPLYGWYVWDKLSGLMGDWKGRLAPAHEWIFHFAKQPKRANKTEPTKYAENGVTHYKKGKVGLRGKDGTMKGFTSAGKEVNQTKVIDSVIRVQPQRGGIDGHPAPFSVTFAETLVEVYANTNEIVYEPFAGSGTTLVACQNLQRKCRAIEISQNYCAVILQRMSDAFPDLVIERLE